LGKKAFSTLQNHQKSGEKLKKQLTAITILANKKKSNFFEIFSRCR
jgi:hypothetical protein